MTYEQYKIINNFIKEHSIRLMKNENKNSTPSGFPMSNYIDYNPHQSSPKYFVATTNIFKAIIFDENYLAKLASKKPGYFETGNALDVLKGIILNDENFKIAYKNRVYDFSSLLSKAHGYVVKLDDNKPHPDVLRLDLFRKLEKSKENSDKYDFIGGLFHSFKHFSINNVNLSTSKDKNELIHTMRIISFAIDAFFKAKRNKIEKGFKLVVSDKS